MTGETSVFTVYESAAGAFSGHETVFWTTAGSCSKSDITDGVNNGTITASNYSGVVSSMTLLHLQPAVYTLCYDWDGSWSAAYALQSQVSLNLTGMWVVVFGLGCVFAVCEAHNISCICLPVAI